METWSAAAGDEKDEGRRMECARRMHDGALPVAGVAWRWMYLFGELMLVVGRLVSEIAVADPVASENELQSVQGQQLCMQEKDSSVVTLAAPASVTHAPKLVQPRRPYMHASSDD